MNTNPIATDFAAIAAAMQQTTLENFDAELLGSCADLADLQKTRLQWDAGEIELSEDQSAALVGKWLAAVKDIEPRRPQTHEGLRAKAVALQTCIDGTMGSDGDQVQSFARALAADVLAAGWAVAAEFRNPDAELIRRCHQFAEAEISSWYRYVIAAENLADEQDTAEDSDGYNWITATPATTPAGWHAKALAWSAWHRTGYFDDEDSDGTSALLASLLQDMVAPARNAIMAKLFMQYGPLPACYTPEGRFLGYPEDAPEVVRDAPAAAERKEPAPEMRGIDVDTLWRLLSSMVGFASKQCTAAGYPPLPHQEAQS